MNDVKIVTSAEENNIDLTSHDNHEHRYFLFESRSAYEVYTPENVTYTTPTLYQKNEYAISGCPCGAVIKQQIN